MSLDKILVGKFYVYVAAAASTADFLAEPGAPWELLGTGWHEKGSGIKHKIARSYNDIRVENELEPIDAQLESVDQTLEVRLLDWSAEALAWAIHADGSSAKVTTVAPAALVEGAKTTTLELDSDTATLAVMVFGASPYEVAPTNAGPNYLRMYWPLARVDGDWEVDFMLARSAPNPIAFKKLKHATIDGQYHLQTADAP